MNSLTTIVAVLAMGQAADPIPELESALAAAELSTSSARFDEDLLRFFRQGEYITPLYSALSSNPWRGPFIAEAKRKELVGQAGKVSDALMSGGAWLGWGTRRTLIGNPIAAAERAAQQPGALEKVIQQMRVNGNINARTPSVAQVPQQVRQSAALILSVARESLEFRRLAFKDMPDVSGMFRQFALAKSEGSSPTAVDKTLRAYQSVKVNYLAAGAHDLLMACQKASEWLSDVPATSKYDFELDTSWGVIRLTGGNDNRHQDEPALLIIDTGGSDTYINTPSTATMSNWCSIVIDAAGADRYVSDRALLDQRIEQFSARKGGNRPGPAGAVFGYAFLFDLAGNDLYRSHRPGLGSGSLGVGVLYDREGEDVYDAYADSQGFGLFGAGMLEDGEGDDRYTGFNQVQGCGLTQGWGYLVDRGGNDSYTCNDTVIDFPSAQSAQHNTSMAQGAGYGRRADYLDRQSLAGGAGVLFDLSGNDRYSCGVFGQGVGYWEGVGMLWDSAGNDQYRGMWYVMGASAHFAIGYCEDLNGSDLYDAAMNMAVGAGHDFSVGYMFDHAGNDTYKAPNLSFGAGNANGIGWFVDFQGDDTYTSTGITLGKAAEAPSGSLRERGLTLGVFMDLAGRDAYPAGATWAKEGTKGANWTSRRPRPSDSQVGVFWDR